MSVGRVYEAKLVCGWLIRDKIRAFCWRGSQAAAYGRARDERSVAEIGRRTIRDDRAWSNGDRVVCLGRSFLDQHLENQEYSQDYARYGAKSLNVHFLARIRRRLDACEKRWRSQVLSHESLRSLRCPRKPLLEPKQPELIAKLRR